MRSPRVRTYSTCVRILTVPLRRTIRVVLSCNGITLTKILLPEHTVYFTYSFWIPCTSAMAVNRPLFAHLSFSTNISKKWVMKIGWDGSLALWFRIRHVLSKIPIVASSYFNLSSGFCKALTFKPCWKSCIGVQNLVGYLAPIGFHTLYTISLLNGSQDKADTNPRS